MRSVRIFLSFFFLVLTHCWPLSTTEDSGNEQAALILALAAPAADSTTSGGGSETTGGESGSGSETTLSCDLTNGFRVNKVGTITYTHNIIWKQNHESGGIHSWSDGKALCENIGWRLPTRSELDDVDGYITDYDGVITGTDSSKYVFLDETQHYWTSSQQTSNDAYQFRFRADPLLRDGGYVVISMVTNRVHCVCDP